jgi:predicted alpha/beta superfamily hydrolase
MKLLSCLALLLFAASLVQAQPLPDTGLILIVKDKSGLSSTESPLYLASNWGGWAPGDNAYKLSARSDMRWQIILKPTSKDLPPLEFKITRGSWDACEVAADLSDIPNRRLPAIDIASIAPGQPAIVEIEVEGFSDQRPEAQARKALSPYRTINAVGTVRRITVVGGGIPGAFRDALVWLPPGYDDPANADRRYPVLYMHDGQNLFEQIPGLPAEWRADETATELTEFGKITPLIIVGVPHAGPGRASEYLPIPVLDDIEPRGEAYVNFLISEVIPRVERAFRTAPGAENRAIGGASLGGLISLYAATRHPQTFGKVLAESPSLVLRGKRLTNLFSDADWPQRVYLGMGGKETAKAETNAALVAAVKDLYSQLEARGLSTEHRMLLIDENAVHDEGAWAKRFPTALKFLFPAH